MNTKHSEPYHKIGHAAKSLNISVELIRAYEREGILIPKKTDTGQRLFNDSDVHWINCIRRLINEQGLNIEGIRRLLALIPCWELKPCAEEERNICPAYLGAVKPCWMIKKDTAGTCAEDNCRKCNVYQSAINCDNIKKMLYQNKPISCA